MGSFCHFCCLCIRRSTEDIMRRPHTGHPLRSMPRLVRTSAPMLLTGASHPGVYGGLSCSCEQKSQTSGANGRPSQNEERRRDAPTKSDTPETCCWQGLPVDRSLHGGFRLQRQTVLTHGDEFAEHRVFVVKMREAKVDPKL